MPDLTATFAAGRGPAAWRREMRRLLVPWGAVRRAAGWLPSLLMAPPPLRPRPLLGDSLPALTAGRTEVEEPPAAARRGKARAAKAPSPAAGRSRPRLEPPARRRRDGDPAPVAGGDRTRAARPEVAERRASRGLLDRLAAGAPLASRRASTGPNPSRPTRPRPAAAPGSGRRNAPFRSQVRDRARTGARELATRALRILRRGSFAASTGDRIAAAAPSATAGASTEAPAGPETRTLGGETAPRYLLDRWLTAPDHDPREASRGSASSRRDDRSQPSQATDHPAGGRDSDRRGPGTPPPGPRRRTAAAGVTETSGAQPHGGAPATAEPSTEPRRRAAAAPTAASSERPGRTPLPPIPGGDPSALAAATELIPAPPSLLPANAADFTAAGTAARVLDAARRRSEVAPGEDLGALADRLGRLLAEEARRHGIDV